ncbi:MAG: xanthine dehydrogenase family protein subunit M [Bauldia sp.]|nr:MAG: xanthine dehydrogenase family protein subunit M [Bauldia sp.]
MALDIVRVDSLRRAAGILAADEGARFLGGGTLLVRAVNSGHTSINRLVFCDGPDFDGIGTDGGRVTLGGAVTMAAIARHQKLAFLGPVAESIGGPAVRAMATVGGNLFARYPYGDFAVALLALGAELVTEDLDRTETLAIDDFLAQPPAIVPRLVRSIVFKTPPAGAFRYAKVVRKHPHGASVLSIAAVLPISGEKIAGARVAYGAMAAKPMRARAVEKALEGNRLDADTIEIALRFATDGCKPLTDPQASDWYRTTVLPVHLKRLLAA